MPISGGIVLGEERTMRIPIKHLDQIARETADIEDTSRTN